MNNSWESGESGESEESGGHAQHNAEQRGESLSTNFPKSDADRQVWFNNFAFTIATDTTRYGLAFGDAGKLFQRAAEFDRMLALSQAPGTRSPAVIAKMNRIRAAADTVFRQYANRIKADPSISTADKLALGFRIASPAKQSPAAPTLVPLLLIIVARDGAHDLVCADETAPHRRSKPKGVAFLDLRIFIAPGVIPHPDFGPGVDPEFAGRADVTIRTERITRMRFTIEHDRAHAGRTATYFGRWQTRSGASGPWSQPVSMTIAVVERGA